MKKASLRKSEVVAYLEEKILHNENTVEEMELYENYKWTNELEKNNTYARLVKEMFAEYRGE